LEVHVFAFENRYAQPWLRSYCGSALTRESLIMYGISM
jgi:hypothetical protein